MCNPATAQQSTTVTIITLSLTLFIQAGQQAIKFSEAFSKSDAQVSSLHEQLTRTNDKLINQTSVLEEYKKTIKSMEQAAAADSHSLMKKMKTLEDRVRELQNVIGKKTSELEESIELNRKLKRECQSTRQDAEGMLQVMSGLEKQVNEFAAREGELEKLSKEYRNRMEEALTSRDQVHTTSLITHSHTHSIVLAYTHHDLTHTHSIINILTHSLIH
jgi:chromosome segregation ATPase